MAPLPLRLGTVGVGDQLEVAKDPPQPRRIQPSGRRQQDRFGLDGEVVGEGLGAVGQHPSMGDREIPTGQGSSRGGQGTPEQGPGGPHRAGGRPGPQAQPGPQPGRGRASLRGVLGAGGPAGIHPGEFLEPLAFQAVDQAAQPQHPRSPDRVGEAVQVLGGQRIDVGGQGGQPVHPLMRRWSRMCVRVHGGNLSSHHLKASTTTQSVDNRFGADLRATDPTPRPAA
jgi:hypothetical protein